MSPAQQPAMGSQTQRGGGGCRPGLGGMRYLGLAHAKQPRDVPISAELPRSTSVLLLGLHSIFSLGLLVLPLFYF